MAKEQTPAAQVTPELPGLRRRGRPTTGKAMSNAERQARYRAKRAKASDSVEAPGSDESVYFSKWVHTGLSAIQEDMDRIASMQPDVCRHRFHLIQQMVADMLEELSS